MRQLQPNKVVSIFIGTRWRDASEGLPSGLDARCGAGPRPRAHAPRTNTAKTQKCQSQFLKRLIHTQFQAVSGGHRQSVVAEQDIASSAAVVGGVAVSPLAAARCMCDDIHLITFACWSARNGSRWRVRHCVSVRKRCARQCASARHSSNLLATVPSGCSTMTVALPTVHQSVESAVPPLSV